MRVVAFVVVFVAGIAHADNPGARAAYERGVKLYRADDFARAAIEFERAYELDPDPAYLFNVAQAHRLAKHCTEAFEAYGKFLEKAPRASNREEAEGYRKELARCAKPPATPREPDPPTPPPPARQPDPLPRPAEPRDPVPVETPSSNRKLIGSIAIGAGSLVAAAGGGIGWRRFEYTKERDATNDGGRAAELDTRAARDLKIMVGGFVAGGALIGAGIYLLATSSERRSTIAIVPIAGGALASHRFEF
jgi:tetratricopeptide (TPR) repeat protein